MFAMLLVCYDVTVDMRLHHSRRIIHAVVQNK